MNNYEKAIESAKALPDQGLSAWKQALSLKLPDEYNFCHNIVFCAMGGSALPAHVVQSVFDIHVPFIINSTPHLPRFANENTLVILASYSGTTAEVLSCYAEAVTRGCKILGLTSGGQLGRILEENEYPLLKYDGLLNSSGQPRMGTCYGMFGLLGILHILSYVQSIEGKLSDFVVDALKKMRGFTEAAAEAARDVAPMLKGKLPVIFGAEHLTGNAHILSNQLNETAKTFSAWFSLPEANHHLLEGLKHPEVPLTGVFLKSNKYEKDTKERIDLTKELMEKDGSEGFVFEVESGKPFSEALTVLMFSSFLTIELSKEYEEDPLSIETVDYFKEQLEKN